MNIFSKECPECGIEARASAHSCDCGYVFSASSDSADAVRLMSQEEEAYEAYLAARLDQARIAAERAIELLSQDPTDRQKVADAERANRELSEINAEYELQLVKLEEAQAEADRARAEAALNQAKLEAEATRRIEELEQQKQKMRELERKRDAIKASSQARVTETSEPMAAADKPLKAPPRIVSLGSTTAASNELDTSALVGKPDVSGQRTVTRARTGRVRQDTSAAIQARRAAQQLIAQKAEASASRRTGASMPSGMKESMYQRAEQVAKTARHTSYSISGDLVAAAEALDSRITHFDGASLAPSRSTQQCPNCTANLPRSATRCSCGFQFTTGATMPGLTGA